MLDTIVDLQTEFTVVLASVAVDIAAIIVLLFWLAVAFGAVATAAWLCRMVWVYVRVPPYKDL